MHPEWARSLRDQCAAARVPYHFKQWGEFAPVIDADGSVRSEGDGRHQGGIFENGEWSFYLAGDRHADVWRVGKKAAGRLLDGIEHNGMPA